MCMFFRLLNIWVEGSEWIAAVVLVLAWKKIIFMVITTESEYCSTHVIYKSNVSVDSSTEGGLTQMKHSPISFNVVADHLYTYLFTSTIRQVWQEINFNLHITVMQHHSNSPTKVLANKQSTNTI